MNMQKLTDQGRRYQRVDRWNGKKVFGLISSYCMFKNQKNI